MSTSIEKVNTFVNLLKNAVASRGDEFTEELERNLAQALDEVLGDWNTKQKQVKTADDNWTDLRVAASSVQDLGLGSPVTKIFRSQPFAGVGTSLRKSANAQKPTSTLTGANVGIDGGASSYTVAFWFQADSFTGNQNIIAFGAWAIQARDGGNEIRFNGSNENIDGASIAGQKTLVVASYDTVGDVASLYLNNVEVNSIAGVNPDDRSGNTLEIFDTNGSRGRIDALQFYNKVLSPAEMTALWAGGNGVAITGLEDGLIAGYNFNEGSGLSAAEVNGGASITLIEDDWGEGLAPSGVASGVVIKAFSPDVVQEVFFEVQLPHEWIEGTELRPHVHYAPLDGDMGEDKVIWGLEYVVASPGVKFPDNTTIIITDGVPNAGGGDGVHTIDAFTDSIDMTDNKISTMLACRLFRDATNVEDTYSGEVGLLEIDFHFLLDTLGSQQEFVKD